MKPEIKQRIEQIKAGQVPEGYKRTRAGIMPYDWCCDREYRAKDIFKSITNKKHNGEFDVLSATQDKGVIPREQVNINIKYNKDSVAGYKKVDKGDFVISLRSFQGGIEYSEYEGLVSPAYTVLKPTIPICDKYYKCYFKTSDYINRLNIGTYGIRDGKQIGYEDFGDMVIHYPPLAEQEKIAKILSVQDRIIELYQLKIEELQKMKKVYLSKMFPKKGENVPEWRFSQFTAAWEQRKLGEVSESYSGGTPSVSVKEYYGGQIPFIRSAEINSEITELFLTEEGLKNSSARLVAVGDILYALYGATSGEVGRARLKGAINQAILVIKPHTGYDSEYLAQWLRKSKHSIIETYLQGGQGNLSGTIVKELSVDFPSLKEQQVIGDFFRQLDNLIALHQRKLDETKKYKKALMQLLLTGIVRCKG